MVKPEELDPQAMAVKMNKKITAGPPSALAFPMVLKIPAPTMAAIPKAVKSLVVKCFPSEWCPSASFFSTCFSISWTVFFLNKSMNAIEYVWYKNFDKWQTNIKKEMKYKEESANISLANKQIVNYNQKLCL